jgi:hypothetical protein
MSSYCEIVNWLAEMKNSRPCPCFSVNYARTPGFCLRLIIRRTNGAGFGANSINEAIACPNRFRWCHRFPRRTSLKSDSCCFSTFINFFHLVHQNLAFRKHAIRLKLRGEVGSSQENNCTLRHLRNSGQSKIVFLIFLILRAVWASLTSELRKKVSTFRNFINEFCVCFSSSRQISLLN